MKFKGRYYKGVFTGKMVKPLSRDEDISRFYRGDTVLVFHLKDFLEFYDPEKIKEEERERIKKQLKKYLS